MKVLTFLLLLASLTIHAQSTPSLVGEWQGIEGTDTMAFVFEADSIVTMLNKTRNESIGGRDVMRNGKRVQLIYLVNASEKPFQIDMIIREVGTKNELGRMAGIFEFVSDKQIKLNLGGSKTRPTEFNEDTLIITKRD